jgi:uncharacterized membrane protein
MKYALSHYYGDVVRYLFLAGGILMLITLPMFQPIIGIPTIVSVISIAVLGIAAGLTNPKLSSSATANFLISAIGFVVFAYNAVQAYQNPEATDKFLLTTVLLGLIFLFALYFSMKTLRAHMLSGPAEEKIEE